MRSYRQNTDIRHIHNIAQKSNCLNRLSRKEKKTGVDVRALVPENDASAAAFPVMTTMKAS